MPGGNGPTVALDGVGAEQGFGALAEGTRAAAADGIGVRVFGPPEELALEGVEGVEVVPTSDWIGNDEDPVPAVRGRREASVVRAARDVAEGRADGLVSHGSTGATMAAATFGLKRMRGVQRPALAVRLPLPGQAVLFLDVGANVDVRAQHLVQFAFLGAAFSEAVLGVAAPRVGLLSVGEEAGKGREEVVAAHAILADAPGIDFAGNVEGRDLPAAAADVVVTDGFTGNVALKLMEGTARTVTGAIRGAAGSNPVAALGGLLVRGRLAGLREALSPDNVAGAYLLGLRGLVVVCHGNSTSRAIANAIALAERGVEERVVEAMTAALRAAGVLRDSGGTPEAAGVSVPADSLRNR